jgi:hypothetical protein
VTLLSGENFWSSGREVIVGSFFFYFFCFSISKNFEELEFEDVKIAFYFMRIRQQYISVPEHQLHNLPQSRNAKGRQFFRLENCKGPTGFQN